MGVTAVHTPPASFLRDQLDALYTDLPPVAIKIGLLATRELAVAVGAFLQSLRRRRTTDDTPRNVWVVLDPVMIATSGSRLLDAAAQQALVDHVIPYVDLVTPNLYEALALLGRSASEDMDALATSPSAVEAAARELLQLGCPAVLVKGGHALDTADEGRNWARDYFLSSSSTSSTPATAQERRLCDEDAPTGVWLQTPRTDTIHTHGTGCTLSASIAAALALGEHSRRTNRVTTTSTTGSSIHPNHPRHPTGGAFAAIQLVDACCLAKAYVAAGIAASRPLGQGPGPVAHTGFPASHPHYPVIPLSSPLFQQPVAFRSMRSHSDHDPIGSPSPSTEATLTTEQSPRPTLGRILPIVDSVEWIERLCKASATDTAIDGVSELSDIQLRIKGETDKTRILAIIQEAQTLCKSANVRLWINDYWEEAISAGCFGVHLGQEDLFRCVQAGGLDILQRQQVALGISTHSFGELSAAIGIRPSYISLGPIFDTESKNVPFDAQGLDVLKTWRLLIPPDIPLVAIGGINDPDRATVSRKAGADCVAVIGAVKNVGLNPIDIAKAVSELNSAMSVI